MQWIIRTDQPYQGHAQSFLNGDGTVAFTDGLSVAEYMAERGFTVKVINDHDVSVLDAKQLDGLITDPQPITEQRFQDMLNVLPPCRWHNAGGFEVFHISERLTHDLVSWFAHKDGQYWEFTDYASMPSANIAIKLRAHT